MSGEVDSLSIGTKLKSVDEKDDENNSKKLDKSDKPVAGKKHQRKRKRKHFNAIREQMEFYFGDANLSKDRYLKQLIDKDPYVLLEVFLTFNKMKALAKSSDEIAKSLSSSELLELDESQQKVRRKTALPAERDVDDKTLYVESLPPTADHDWVKQIFSRFGNVSYVSLPKYAKSRKIKEFGFIEFEKQESVAKAVKAFQEFKGVLSMQETDPGELKSVKAFIKEQTNEEESIAENVVEIEEVEKKKENKKRRRIEAETAYEEPKTKKIKAADNTETATTSVTENDSSSSAELTETANDTADAADQNDELSKKKRRKKKKNSKKLNDKTRKRSLEQNNDATFYDLKVLPKRDWKRLRNKYLNLQREKIAELKRKAWREAQQQQHSRENIIEGVDNSVAVKKYKTSERKLHKMNMNFYGAGDTDALVSEAATVKVFAEKEVKQNQALERAPLFNYEPGLIVEVAFLEPCVTVKEFKADMRQYGSVKYVDVKEGVMHAHLRLESVEAGEEFVRQVNCAEYKCKVLAGEAETEYWRKIEQDREMKLNKKVKVPQKRGREKIKKLITKHVRFGDEEEE